RSSLYKSRSLIDGRNDRTCTWVRFHSRMDYFSRKFHYYFFSDCSCNYQLMGKCTSLLSHPISRFVLFFSLPSKQMVNTSIGSATVSTLTSVLITSFFSS